MIDRCASSGSTSRNVPSRCPCAITSATPASTAFIMWKVLASKCGARAASSRSMMGGNHGRAAASSTSALIQASSFCSAEPGPSATARTRAPDGAHHVADDLGVERALAAEVVVEHRLVDAGAGGDAVGAGGVVAALGEFVRRGAEDGGAGVPHGAACHVVLTNQLVINRAGASARVVKEREPPAAGPPYTDKPMAKIIVAGGTGLLGTALVGALQGDRTCRGRVDTAPDARLTRCAGHRPTLLARGHPHSTMPTPSSTSPARRLPADAGRAARKTAIHESRMQATGALVRAITGRTPPAADLHQQLRRRLLRIARRRARDRDDASWLGLPRARLS